MISGMIAAIFIIATICAIGDGDWWAVAVGIGIALIVLFLGCVARTDAKAYRNCVRYWADGGPDRGRR